MSAALKLRVLDEISKISSRTLADKHEVTRACKIDF